MAARTDVYSSLVESVLSVREEGEGRRRKMEGGGGRRKSLCSFVSPEHEMV